MKRLQTILCAALLTLSISSVALAGNISGAPASEYGNISGAPAPSGNISGRAGNISGRNGGGNISGITVGDIFGILLSELF